MVDSEKAVPLAIAANELIHNAIDHGFAGRKEGILAVNTFVEGTVLHVSIKNNGNLLPEDFGVRIFNLGLQIVRNLSELELKGRFEIKNEEGMVSADIYCPLSLMEA